MGEAAKEGEKQDGCNSTKAALSDGNRWLILSFQVQKDVVDNYTQVGRAVKIEQKVMLKRKHNKIASPDYNKQNTLWRSNKMPWRTTADIFLRLRAKRCYKNDKHETSRVVYPDIFIIFQTEICLTMKPAGDHECLVLIMWLRTASHMCLVISLKFRTSLIMWMQYFLLSSLNLGFSTTKKQSPCLFSSGMPSAQAGILPSSILICPSMLPVPSLNISMLDLASRRNDSSLPTIDTVWKFCPSNWLSSLSWCMIWLMVSGRMALSLTGFCSLRQDIMAATSNYYSPRKPPIIITPTFI